MDGNRIAKVIIPVVIFVVIANWATSQPWAPDWASRVFTVALIGAIVGVLVWLFRGSAWGKLARRFPVRQPYSGAWTGCPTLHVSNVSADDPDYDRDKVRFVGMVRLACGDNDLFLSPILPLFSILMPPAQIPLSAITKVKTYQHSGYVETPKSPDAGTFLQITYDPNFRGRIAELMIGEPPIYLQMQADIIEPAIARLPVDRQPHPAPDY